MLNNNRTVQKQVFEQFAPRMLSVCRSYLRNGLEAEDCMISGFCKVFQKINTYQNKGSFEGWMRRIMVNECLAAIRSGKQFIYLEDNAALLDTQSADVADVEYDFDVSEILDEVEDPYRLVFNLYVLEDLSHKEIAEMLGITVTASKTQLHRAKAKIRILVNELNKKKINE